jgi:hypothetical protein
MQTDFLSQDDLVDAMTSVEVVGREDDPEGSLGYCAIVQTGRAGTRPITGYRSGT